MSRGQKYPKLENQPLTLVLAEFRFSPVSDIAAAISEFCNHLGLQDVRFEERISQEIQVGSEGVSFKQPSKVWFSLDHDQGRMIQVEKDRLIMVTTRYPRFDAFAEQCINTVNALETSAKPEHLTRVGLRYNDAVVPLAGENLGQYLHGQLLPAPLLEKTGTALERHRTETLLRTQAGVLALRVLIGRHGQGVMPDLSHRFPLKLPISVPMDRMTAILDFDHYWKPHSETEALFAGNEADKRLRALHQAARAAFWEITTDFARRKRWA